MARSSISTAHMDYLQRAGIELLPLPSSVPTTDAPPDLRRVWLVSSVGRSEKRPAGAERQPTTVQHQRVRLPSEDVLIGLYGYRIPVAYLVLGDSSGVKLHFGTWAASNRKIPSGEALDRRSEILRTALHSLYSTVDMHPVSVKLPDWPLAGLSLGVPSVKPPDPLDGALPMDRLIRAMAGGQWAALILAEPVDEQLTVELRQRLIEEMRRVEEASRSEQAPRPLAKQYTQLLEAALKLHISGMAVGGWRTGVYLLGEQESYYRLASLWSGIYSGDQSLPEPVRVWDFAEARELAAGWALPDTAGDQGPGFYQHPLRYQTLLTSAQLAAYIHLPQLETSGFAVTTVPSFDAVPPPANEDRSIGLGRVMVRGTPTQLTYDLPIDDLTRHLFVAGVTGAGKTNTILHLLRQGFTAGLPFLVIEPAKAEYRSLINDEQLADKLQVFTLGNEQISPFRLNPFEVLPGVPVGVHLDLLRSVFSASFGMWTPLPQVLEQCLHRIYEDHGWETTTGSNYRLDDRSDRADAFPTLSDLARKVEEVTEELGYEDRVTSDLRAALLTRLNSLRTGGKGRMLDVQQSLPMEVLLNRPTVLELESMGDDDDKAFVMGLVLVRLLEHRRVSGRRDGLEHLLVIEEAHRLLTNVGQRNREEQADPRGKAVETFSNLLAEIRAYGQGIIVADQVPVKLAPDVIKNTNVKIAHRVVDAQDRSVLAGSMAMDKRQAHALATLAPGHAAVFSEGSDAPLLVKVPLVTGVMSQPPVDDERVADLARESGLLEAYRSVFYPPGYGGDAAAVEGRARELARQMLEDERFQRALAHLILSTIENPDALDRLWSNLLGMARAERPARLDEPAFLRGIAVQGAAWFSQRRGAQWGWTYGETAAFQRRLEEMLLDKLAHKESDRVREQFRELALELHGRDYDPFPACSRICRQQPPVCLYRHAAADLIDAGDLTSAWQSAMVDDASDPTGDRRKTWEVCMDAGHLLIEIAEDDWPVEAMEASDAAARRASLCFGQQMVAADASKAPRSARRIVDELLKESGHV